MISVGVTAVLIQVNAPDPIPCHQGKHVGFARHTFCTQGVCLRYNQVLRGGVPIKASKSTRTEQSVEHILRSVVPVLYGKNILVLHDSVWALELVCKGRRYDQSRAFGQNGAERYVVGSAAFGTIAFV